MATSIKMRTPSTGFIKQGFMDSHGLLFLACSPALFRGNYLSIIVASAILIIITTITRGVGSFITMHVCMSVYVQKILHTKID